MSQKISHADQAGILVFGRILASLSEALILLLIVRLLGKAEVGMLGAVLLVYQTVALIMTAGFPEALMFALPARPLPERRALVLRICRILVGLGVGAGAVLCVIAAVDVYAPHWLSFIQDDAAGDSEASYRYLALMALFPLTDLPCKILPNLLVVENRAKAAAGVGVIKSLGMTIATIVPLALGLDLWWVVASIDFYGLLYGGVLLYYVSICYRGVEKVRAPMGVREIFSFAIPLGVTDLVSLVNNRVDRFLILATMSAAVFAEYQVGAWQIPFVVTIPYAVGAAYTPKLRMLFKDGNFREGIAVWRLSIRKVSLIVVPITSIFIVAAEETVELLFTSDYTAATIVFRLYCVFTLGRVATFGSVIVAAGKPGYILSAALFSLLANLILSVPLVLWLGFPGPALGTALAFIPTCFIYCVCIAKACNISVTQTFPLGIYAKTLGVAALAAIPALLIKQQLHLGPIWMISLEAITLLGTFALIGGVSRLIQREDWEYMSRWFRLRMGTEK